MMVTTDEAKELAAKWGPAFTSYGLGEKDGAWAAMFADKCIVIMPGEHQRPVLLVQNLCFSKRA